MKGCKLNPKPKYNSVNGSIMDDRNGRRFVNLQQVFLYLSPNPSSSFSSLSTRLGIFSKPSTYKLLPSLTLKSCRAGVFKSVQMKLIVISALPGLMSLTLYQQYYEIDPYSGG